MFWYVLQIYKSSSVIIIAHVVSCVCLSVYRYYFEDSWISHCVFDNIYPKYSYYILNCYSATFKNIRFIHNNFSKISNIQTLK